ncbi:Acetyltransferase (GNAT) domain-containing protein [Collimonas sp. OK607]|uniref:GNAT family N-acetyltransferase n=1 Tax=Collimonas sp. OK607 TaxID=1798194 RepID=UPI0008E44EA4|nr:GNAT family N-acetyltransferase [Collimonas sp. OK607]SFB07489.1 Acetyltransferase (GNAT) domain-containing protein [Collimonas sp. OK607]
MLRLAKISDAPEILQTRIAAIRAQASLHYPAAEIEDWCSSRTAETYHTAIERKIVLVEDVNESVVAFGQLNPETAFIEAVYVSPPHSRQGIGLKILRALEAMAARRGITALTLEASLNAVEFYRRAGYVPVLEEKHPPTPKTSSATLRMRHEIRSRAARVFTENLRE